MAHVAVTVIMKLPTRLFDIRQVRGDARNGRLSVEVLLVIIDEPRSRR
jgi:hypothetical protein